MNDLQTLLTLPQLKCLQFEKWNRIDEPEKEWGSLFKENGVDLKFKVITD